MLDRELFIRSFSHLHASPEVITEVLKMTEAEKQTYTKRHWKRGLTIAIVASLLLALVVTTYATGFTSRIFGWGNNSEIRADEEGRAYTILYTENLTEPVKIENGRMTFLVNNSTTDITDQISEDTPFIYSYADEDGNEHIWLIGLNGPTPDCYGYAEFIRNPQGEWLGGYSARTDLPGDGSLPGWLSSGKESLGIPW